MHLDFFLAGFPLARAIAGQAAATQGPTAILARAERAISHSERVVSRQFEVARLSMADKTGFYLKVLTAA
jgi:hypothetical protein